MVFRGFYKLFLDYCLLLINCEVLNWGFWLFRSFDFWFVYSGFEKFIKKEWLNMGQDSVMIKLKKLGGFLKIWIKEVFGIIDERILILEKEWEKIDLEVKMGDLQDM